MLTWAVTPLGAETANSVLAHVGGKVITEYDVRNLDPRAYREIISIKDEAYRAEQLERYTESALDYLIDQEIVIIAAERERITVTEKEVDNAVSEILARNELDINKLEDALEKEGMSLVKYRYRLKNDILNARVRSQVLMPKIVVAERDLREIADSKPDEYPLNDKYNILMLMTSDKAAIEKALKEIKNGLSFEDAVKKYSIDKSAANGGKLGWMEADIMNPAMLSAVQAVRKGGVSAHFKINGRWAVCNVLDFKSKYDFDNDTRTKLTEEASEKIYKQVFSAWLERNKSTIVVIRRGDKIGAVR